MYPLKKYQRLIITYFFPLFWYISREPQLQDLILTQKPLTWLNQVQASHLIIWMVDHLIKFISPFHFMKVHTHFQKVGLKYVRKIFSCLHLFRHQFNHWRRDQWRILLLHITNFYTFWLEMWSNDRWPYCHVEWSNYWNGSKHYLSIQLLSDWQ